MDGLEEDPGLNDAALDREIEEALAVEPSPDFVARVRLGIANEPRRQAWRVSGTWVIAGCAAIVLIAAVKMTDTRRSNVQVALPPLTAKATTSSFTVLMTNRNGGMAVQQSERGVGSSRPSLPSRVAVAQARASQPEVLPEVLIDPGEAAVLRRLVRGGRGRRVEPATLTASAVADASTTAVIPPLPEIFVPSLPELMPIVVQPIGAMSREEGVRQ